MRPPYSELIRSIRAEHGLTEAMLGRMVGVTAKPVARWEQGKVIVSREQWEKICRLKFI